jgi:hypothetical protein
MQGTISVGNTGNKLAVRATRDLSFSVCLDFVVWTMCYWASLGHEPPYHSACRCWALSTSQVHPKHTTQNSKHCKRYYLHSLEYIILRTALVCICVCAYISSLVHVLHAEVLLCADLCLQQCCICCMLRGLRVGTWGDGPGWRHLSQGAWSWAADPGHSQKLWRPTCGMSSLYLCLCLCLVEWLREGVGGSVRDWRTLCLLIICWSVHTNLCMYANVLPLRWLTWYTGQRTRQDQGVAAEEVFRQVLELCPDDAVSDWPSHALNRCWKVHVPGQERPMFRGLCRTQY